MCLLNGTCWDLHHLFNTYSVVNFSLLLLQAQEALRRAKFKIAGRQKIVVSRNWYGFIC